MGLTQLIEKVKQNDQQAFEELYNQYYQMGFSLALQFVKNEDEAMDIIQDVFITVHSKIDLLEDAEKFKSWYMQIVANKCRDFLKKNKDLSFTDVNAYDEDGALQFDIEDTDREFIPEQAMDYSETVRIVDEMLAELPEDQRMCLLLYFANDMKISEIAKALQVSEATVKSRLKYGKDKMREKVETYQKKTGTKLYSISALSIIPFIRWMFNNKQFFAPASPEKTFQAIWNVATSADNGWVGNAATIFEQGSNATQNVSNVVSKFSNLKDTIINNISSLTGTQKVVSIIAAGTIFIGTTAGVVTTVISSNNQSASNNLSTSANDTLELKDYLKVKFNGANGKATAKLTVDFAKLENAIGKERVEEYAVEILGSSENVSLKHLLVFSLSSKKSLTNGDTITVNVEPTKALKSLGVTLSDVENYFGINFDTPKFTVENLEEFEDLDILNIVKDHLIYKGSNGNAYAHLDFNYGHRETISNRVYLEFTPLDVTIYVDGKSVGTCDISLFAPNPIVRVENDLEIILEENGPLSNGEKLEIELGDYYLTEINEVLKEVGYVIENTTYYQVVSGL